MTIRELRREKGLTQARLGEILGVSGKTIASYENGRACPSDGVIARIWEVYGVDIATGKKTEDPENKPVKKAKKKKPDIIIQSPMGGEITPEEILAKMPEGIDAVYVRVDQNKLWWVRGVDYGDIDIWA